ncbi:F0F1 ATP synthase subunit A [Caldimonas thermodepolymerans]|jgi:F-type H+-transporting ATPase subunit a|uniref:ATP synthase subunit a n=1 Tax=Caldimonas thermodepolymerans TaxID=215580 RepID=A0AA46HVX5_9BURK|nr:F0F1 ATP synthase subunit A [Caldimonas thermodepolymerans]TCP07518.1 F-type H+-transporting ATPase subunit a [Caldimonas thermodepolymerans]UZG44024.1 F0F1 ATP synthase subunit A [Caldimonas thermodepolymerans]UZG47690.1 F0F1 ATP synthase subunit A [Caldimonas thermodepolymerans]
MAAEGHGPTPGEYIQHHLQHFQNRAQEGLANFSLSEPVLKLDSLFWAIVLGVIGCFFLWRIAKAATSGVPGRAQAFVEMMVELVDTQAKGIIHNEASRRAIAPLALTAFVWIFLMNAMDLLPVDLIPRIWEGIYAANGGDPHHAYMRVVPTADLSVTLGLAITVLLARIYYNIKIKGLGGWIKELFSAPFHAHGFMAVVLAPVNLIMQIIEFTANTISHGMRLFGNMFAGELVFMLIALLGGAAALSLGGALLFAGHVIAGAIWAIFHILIITLQAFIFMMLTLVYLGQAHDKH